MNKKKLQMIEFPSISNTIKKYDNFQNEIIIPAPKKIQVRRIYKVKGFNKSVVAMAIFYIVLLVSVMMMKMWMTYNVSNLGIEKTNVENKLNELKKEDFGEIGVAVLHAKIKEKTGKLPEGIHYFSGITVDDWWINYPWDAHDIDEHNRLAESSRG